MKKHLINLAYIAVLVAAAVVIWTVAAIKAGSEFVLPSVKQTMHEIMQVLAQKAFYLAFFATLKRTVLSFLISFFLALFLAVLSEMFLVVKKLFAPILSILRSLPTMSIILLLLLWTNRQAAPQIVAILVMLPTLYAQLTGGFSALDKQIFQMAKVYNITNTKLFFSYILPQMLPIIAIAAGTGLSLNLKLMVSAEVLSQTANSLGHMMNMSKLYFETARLMALTVITVVTGIVIELLFNLLKPLWRWRND